MTDLVERLRASDGFRVVYASDGKPGILPDVDLMREAAAEVEQLRNHVRMKHDEILLLRSAMADRDHEADDLKEQIERLTAENQELMDVIEFCAIVADGCIQQTGPDEGFEAIRDACMNRRLPEVSDD